jgi:hypothetical protein
MPFFTKTSAYSSTKWVAVSCSILFFSFFCLIGCDDKKNSAKTASNTSITEASAYRTHANVFIDNSIRMDGYVNGNTEFKKDVPDLLRGIELKTDNLSLFYINSDGSYPDTSSDKIGEIGNLDYIKFTEKSSSDVRKSVLRDMISTALSAASDTSLSILISDFTIPIDTNSPDKYRPDFVISSIVKASNEIKGFINQREKDVSLLVLRLESKFVGDYYDYKGKCYIDTFTIKFLKDQAVPIKKKYEDAKWRKNDFAKKISGLQPELEGEAIAELEKERIKWKNRENSYKRELDNLTKEHCVKITESFERPYFVWIFGTISQIEKVLASEFFKDTKKKESENYWLGKYVKGNFGSKFVNLRKAGATYDKVKDDSIIVTGAGKRKVEIGINWNFDKIVLLFPEIIEYSSKYNVSDADFFVDDISKINEKGYSHRIVLKSKHEKKDLTASSVKIEIKPEYTWVKDFSYETDTLFSSVDNNGYKAKKTLGLENLLGDVYDVFYTQPLDSFQIKIGVKK